MEVFNDLGQMGGGGASGSCGVDDDHPRHGSKLGASAIRGVFGHRGSGSSVSPWPGRETLRREPQARLGTPYDAGRALTRAVGAWELRDFVTVLLCLFAVTCIVAFSSGCLTDQQKKDVAFDVYAAQQQACIDQYADKPSIDKCRARVQAAWAKDAGK